MAVSYTSLSGLNAASQQLGVTSNNIANANSLAFKRSVTSFKDVYSSTPSQMATDFAGSGVADGVAKQVFTQGSLQSTQNMLNLAITGQGFFQVNSATTKLPNYTRSGNFSLNANNYVVNEDGDQLMAASLNDKGQAITGFLSPLKIPPRTVGMYKTSTQLKQNLTLPSDGKVITAPFDRNDPSTYSISNSIDLIDDAGRTRQGRIYYIKTQDPGSSDPYGQWKTVMTVDGQVITPALRTYTKTSEPNKTTADTYTEWAGSGDSRDVLSLSTDKVALTEKDVMSVVGSKVYQGDGKNAVEVGSIDPVKNGLGGQALRINWVAKSFDNAGFDGNGSASDPLPGWTVIDTPVMLDGNSTIGGWPTPVDLTNPPGSPGDQVSVSGSSLLATRNATGGVEGAGAQLSSSGTVSEGFGIMRGPAIISQKPIDIQANGQVAFDWKASGSRDAYDVYAYLLNTETGETVKLFDQTGATAGENTDWAHVTATVPKAGKYQFVFVSGSYDASGGRATGAQLFVDNIQTDQKPDVNKASLDVKVKYIQTVDDTEGVLRFDRAGKLDPALTQLSYTNPYGTGTGLAYDLTGTRAVNAKYAVNSSSQNGRPDGSLESLDVGSDGLVKATYSNGVEEKLAKIVLANFVNPSALRQLGDSRYVTSAESGQAVFSEAGANGMGDLRAGAIEMSNVDVTVELVDLIMAQRNFQANAKAIETNNQMIKSMSDNIR
jgi:flagellar hook-basal body protein